MNSRDRRFYIWILVGRIYSSHFQSGDIQRWCHFHLVISGKNAVLPGNRLREFDDVFAAKRCCFDLNFCVFMRVLRVCRFDTGIRDDFWSEDMIFGWRIWVFVGRFKIDFRKWIWAHCSYNASSCYVVPCHARSRGDIGVVVCNAKGGCLLYSIIRRIRSIGGEGVPYSCGGMIVRGFFCG